MVRVHLHSVDEPRRLLITKNCHTFGLNTKGGMDDEEFKQYIVNSILPLYPNTRDKPGHRLLLKCDSGPGRLQVELLAQLRFLGVYLSEQNGGDAGDGSNLWHVQKPIQGASQVAR